MPQQRMQGWIQMIAGPIVALIGVPLGVALYHALAGGCPIAVDLAEEGDVYSIERVDGISVARIASGHERGRRARVRSHLRRRDCGDHGLGELARGSRSGRRSGRGRHGRGYQGLGAVANGVVNVDTQGL